MAQAAKNALAVCAPVFKNKDNAAGSDELIVPGRDRPWVGPHVIIDLWEAEDLHDEDLMERTLLDAVVAISLTPLHVHLHKFPGSQSGVSGVVTFVERQGHISVHTWPERGYAAFDVLVCDGDDPKPAAPVLKLAFKPKRVVIGEHKRGDI